MENKFYLAIETKPNNYFPINIGDVKLFQNKITTNLEELDALTLKFTKKEIMNAIKEANLLEIEEDMPLIVLYYEKGHARKIKALTKDISFDMWASIKENYANKNYQNKIINYLNNKVSPEELEKIKESTNLEEFLKSISSIPYFMERKLYFYLYEN